MNPVRWGRRVVQVALDSLRLFMRAQGLSWGAAVGLYLFLSVPPLMIASSLVFQVGMNEYQAEDFIVDQAAKFLPARLDVILGVFASDAGPTLATALVSLGFLAFSGTRAFAALISAVNVMWHRSDRLGFLEAQLTRVWMLGLSLALLALAALGEMAIAAVTDGRPNADGQVWLLQWQLLPSLLLAIFLFVIYRVLPQANVSSVHAAIGAVIGTIGVRIAQAVMGFMSEAGTFETPYGALAGVALLATWALVVGIVVLFGATVVAVLSGRLDELREHGPDPHQG